MRSGRYIRSAVFAATLAVLALLPSCVTEEEPQPAGDPVRRDVQVGFRLVLGGTQPRDTRSGGYDDGTGTDYENYIDFLHNDYRVLFFDTRNRYLAAFRPTDLVPLDENPIRSRRYDVIGRAAAPLPESFKIVILANWGDYPADPVVGQTTIDDICTGGNGRYAYAAPFRLSADRTIPMYGVKRCEGVSFEPDELTYLGTVCMLRAMAKVEVKCVSKEWTIETVSMLRYNTAGYCAPAGVYDESDYVKNDYDLDYTDEVHVVENAAAEGRLDFERLDDGRFVIYVPEYRNTAGGALRADDAAEIRVKFDLRQDQEYAIEFKYYGDPLAGSAVGDYFDLKRNCYYRFSVDKLPESEEMSVSIDVDPYDQYDLGPIFGL